VDGILGLKEESDHNQLPLIEGLVNMVLEFRNQARAVKNWAESDRIRDRLSGLGIRIKDSKEGTRWEL
jgi:cysteinyl-tRNA synthetase